jgi:protein-S-isoprenylcysteine O-methyltransferase Ste14
MTRNRTKVLLVRVKGYAKENLGAPFIVVFMLLLIVAAVSLSAGWSSLADTIAIYAFYALVVGVALQLICFMKYPRRDYGEDSDGSS